MVCGWPKWFSDVRRADRAGKAEGVERVSVPVKIRQRMAACKALFESPVAGEAMAARAAYDRLAARYGGEPDSGAFLPQPKNGEQSISMAEFEAWYADYMANAEVELAAAQRARNERFYENNIDTLAAEAREWANRMAANYGDEAV